jgi:hypothetical protein
VVVLRQHPFNQQQASYLAYLRRYKASEALEGRVRFDDFLRYEQRLAENEFFMAGLRGQGKMRGGAMPRLIKQQKDLRATLLIVEEETTKEVTSASSSNVTEVKTDMQGPTGVRGEEII